MVSNSTSLKLMLHGSPIPLIQGAAVECLKVARLVDGIPCCQKQISAYVGTGANNCRLARKNFASRIRSTPVLSVMASNSGVLGSPETANAIPFEFEEQAHQQLLNGPDACIAGIPKQDWLMLQKPMRYMGNEFGAVNKDWGSASIRFSLTYPEIYEVGASNLGHIVLYTVLNETEGLLCDRCYMPADDMVAQMHKHDVPLFAVESKRPLAEFDVLGFSLSYELGGTNVLEMLSLARIPVSWEERAAADESGAGGGGVCTDDADVGNRSPTGGRPWDPEKGSLPLIFAGGPTATSNPEPFSDFFDFFALGDGEDCLPEIGRCLQACKAEGLSRHETLLRLAKSVAGVYVPQLYERLDGWGGAVFPKFEGVPERILRRVATPNPFQQIGLVPYVTTVHDRLTIEIRRGCTRGCRFCQPGMLTRPARDVDPDQVVRAVEEGMRKTGYNEFSLLSLSCSDYLALPAVGIEIKNRLKDEPVTLSLPSQRVDRFDDNIANIVGGRRQSGLTFAPEAGTLRLRDIINKGLTNEELLRGVMTAWERGWRQVKLYFMIGLPGETDADVMGIVETVKMLQSRCRRGKSRLSVKLTISNFTPKPHTPFQWHSVSTAEFKRKQRMLLSEFQRMGGVKYNFTDVRLSAMEDFIGRGDRRIGQVIRRAWELRATNDAWWMNTESNFDKWSQAIEESGLNWKYRQVDVGEWDVLESVGDERFRGQGGGGRGRLDRGSLADPRLDAPLPWDIVNTGVSKWWLKADLQRALEAGTVPDCSHSGLCSECGVCGDDFGHNVVAEVPEIPAFEGHFEPNTERAQRLRVTYGKEGSMALIGHLDLIHVFDRAMRRAAIPVSYDHGIHPRPRISNGLALSLGYTSSGELVDVELREPMSVFEFRQRLTAQLPPELPFLGVEEVPLKRADGKYTERLPALLEAQVNLVVLAVDLSERADDEEGEGEEGKEGEANEEPAGPSQPPPTVDYERWVEDVNALPSFEVSMESKDKKKPKVVDLRQRLRKLSVRTGPLPRDVRDALTRSGSASAVLRVDGAYSQTEGALRAEGVVRMLEKVSGLRFSLLHVHRLELRLRAPSTPEIDTRLLRAVGQDETFRALYRRFDGTSRLDGTQPINARDAAMSAQRAVDHCARV